MGIEIIIALGLLFIVLRAAKHICTPQYPPYQFPPDPDKLPYSKKYLLTKNEYPFYLVLKKVCDKHNALICPKVGLKDIANVSDPDNYEHWFYKINAKHVDFVICDAKLVPYCAIELDDSSHQRAEVKERDAFKNKFFASIGLPLFRFTLRYSESEIEATLFPKGRRK